MKFNKWLTNNISLDKLHIGNVIQKTQPKEITGIGPRKNHSIACILQNKAA